MKQLHFKYSNYQDLGSMLLVMLTTNQLKTFRPLVNMHLHQLQLEIFFSPTAAESLMTRAADSIWYCVVGRQIPDTCT